MAENGEMGETPGVTLVRSVWDAVNRAGIEAAIPFLDSRARWRAVEDGPWNCEGRQAILAFFAKRDNQAPAGRLESAVDVEGRIVVGFRPALPPDDGWPLEEGIRYVVVTVADGRITELKGCPSREVALAYARDPVPPPAPA